MENNPLTTWSPTFAWLSNLPCVSPRPQSPSAESVAFFPRLRYLVHKWLSNLNVNVLLTFQGHLLKYEGFLWGTNPLEHVSRRDLYTLHQHFRFQNKQWLFQAIEQATDVVFIDQNSSLDNYWWYRLSWVERLYTGLQSKSTGKKNILDYKMNCHVLMII